MIKNFWIYIRGVFGARTGKSDRLVGYSVKKYFETYKLLEEYDKKGMSDPKILANSGRLREVVQRFQGVN